ncbi:MAG: hypothetical protein RIQ56_286, partial [Candidatus Parcubacteria bacterium]
GRDPEESNEPVARAMQQFGKVVFVPDLTGPVAKGAVSSMRDGEIVFLENVRRDPREVANDEGFAKELSTYGDMYVGDAFAAAHRAHASIVGIAKFLPAYGGFLMRNEVDALNAAQRPEKPSFAILGGAKFETKAPLISKLLATYDHVFIVGALANDVFKARGLPVGKSLVSKEEPSKEILENPNFIAPVDVTVEQSDGQSRVKKVADVLPDDKIMDIGPDSVALVAPYIADAKFILWNGTTGYYEGGYVAYMKAIGELAGKSSAQKVLGGGDTIAAIEASGVDQSKLGFLSTGGGAMLEYLLKGSLPGVEVLN